MNGDDRLTRSTSEPSAAALRTTLGVLPLIALSAALTGPAYAQDDAAEASEGAITLDTVVVQDEGGTGYRTERLSSPKATVPLLDTPQTVSVIPQQVIEERGASNLTEVLRNTPGISFNAGENAFSTSTDSFQMRGFDASGSVFIDGARDSGNYRRDTFNVEQVEVIKGAAADNGRGGPGGYVNIVTKTPTMENFVRGGAEAGFDGYGSDPFGRATVDVNYVAAAHTAVRINAMVEDGGIAGRDLAELSTWGIAPSVAFGLGTPFRMILAYEHVERRDLPDWGVPGATLPGLTTYSPSAAGARRDAFYGLRSDFDNVTADAVLARLEYDVTDTVTLSNQTRWSRVDRTARYTVPFGFAEPRDVTTQTQFYDRVNTTLTNQTNLSAEFLTGSFRHNLAMGLELTREKSDADRFRTVNSVTDVFDPNPDRIPGPPMIPTELNAVGIDTIAGYLYDTIELNRHWQVMGGLRAERYSVNIDSRTSDGLPAGGLDGFNDSRSTLGGKVGVVYKPIDNASLYAAFGVSHLPPGSFLSNPDISRTGDNAFPGFVAGARSVRSRNYEIGVKLDLFDGRLQTSAAVFRTEKRNVAITGRDPGETEDSLKGYGQQIVQGVEFGVAGEITEGWNVFGGLTVLKSERKHSAYLDEVRRRASPGDYGDYSSTRGDELSFTPNVTANLWTTYRFPIGLTLGGGVQYVDSSWIGRPDDALRIIPNGRFGKLPSYVLVDLMASYEITENVDIRFNVDNVFDRTYAVSTNWPAARATLGPPRTYRLSTSFKF